MSVLNLVALAHFALVLSLALPANAEAPPPPCEADLQSATCQAGPVPNPYAGQCPSSAHPCVQAGIRCDHWVIYASFSLPSYSYVEESSAPCPFTVPEPASEA